MFVEDATDVTVAQDHLTEFQSKDSEAPLTFPIL